MRTLSLEVQDKRLKRHSGPAASLLDEAESSLAVAAGASEPIGEEGDWNLEGAVGLNKVELVGGNCYFVNFQTAVVQRRIKIFGTVAEPFELRTEVVN